MLGEFTGMASDEQNASTVEATSQETTDQQNDRSEGVNNDEDVAEGNGGLTPDKIANLQEIAARASLEVTEDEIDVFDEPRSEDDIEKLHAHNPLAVKPVRDPEDPSTLPESYRSNTPKEKQLLDFVQNFVRQYRHLYKNRKPLYIAPPNECGVAKFLPTTVRPTLVPFSNIYSHDSAARFVADYLTYDFLEPTSEPPEVLPAPTTTLWRKRGNCFDFAVLLCSLLEGAGYDAYCVHGYATREVCMMDRSRRVVDTGCQSPEVAEQVATPVRRENKYRLKPACNLASKYEQDMQERIKTKKADSTAASLVAEAAARQERRKPKHDRLYGLRTHCWVVVLQGRRGVPENFFIECSLGETASTKSAQYLGIEGVWNSKNYWVNMQDCTQGVADMQYDLGDSACWEYVLPDTAGHPLVSTGELPNRRAGAVSGTVDLPRTWVAELVLDPLEFETRKPHGQRSYTDEASRTTEYAEYHRADGLVRTTTFYEDYELRLPTLVVDEFRHRSDRLVRRETRDEGDAERVDELYARGRRSLLRHHTYYNVTFSGSSKRRLRTMHFHHELRPDGLCRRERTQHQLLETFRGREDGLCDRVVDFEGGGSDAVRRRSSIAPPRTASGSSRRGSAPKEDTIEAITERYRRNPAVPPDEDIAEVVYFDDAIVVTYHKDDKDITAQRREFEKPQLTEKQTYPPIQPDEGVVAYHPNPGKVETKKFALNEIFKALLAKEAWSRQQIAAATAETAELLQRLSADSDGLRLEVSFYDTTRNADAKARRLAQEEDARAAAVRRAAMERDYLAPYLVMHQEPTALLPGMAETCDRALADVGAHAAVWLGTDGTWSDTLMGMYDVELEAFLARAAFTREEADDVRAARHERYVKSVAEHCMADLHDRNTAREKRIADDMDREKRDLREKQQWYHEHQANMTPEQEEEYVGYCGDLIFRIGILEKRLAEHRATARRTEDALENRLHQDPRLEGLA
eukprot:m.1474013 g.1474013  ORF g.1474013 m.1474013 type:complete len:974 (+) comp25152_c1_seq33:182-3103(+)